MNLLKWFVLWGLIIISNAFISAQNYQYSDSWGPNGFKLVEERKSGIVLTYSIADFFIEEHEINGEQMHAIQLPGAFLTNNEGAPGLPGQGQYIAIPEGATVSFRIIESREERFSGMKISPTPVLPLITDEPPLIYEKDMSIYGQDAFYPAQTVIRSEITEIRGVDAIILGVNPFRYNPVTGELIVTRDIKIEVTFSGGTGYFGEERLRSRTWDPILKDMFINRASLPEVDYTKETISRLQDYEYVIITPDNPGFIFWADSLKAWRATQGISTGVFTLSEIGGNTVSAIEGFIDNAYNNWNIAPSAVLLLADYGTNGDNCIVSPTWNSYCVSDNIYADVDGDNLPDLVLARITAQNEDHLETMIGKMINYELQPPTSSDFYNHPVSAGGWQSDRWFILCADICFGFWEVGLEKEPIREFAGYGSGAPSSWSSNPNTGQVVSYFGPSGLGYIPQTPSHLTDWGGNSTRINNDLNDGAFMIIHRDHGEESGWNSPYYMTSSLNGLDNNDLSFVFSINCLTGKYNMGGECFAEAFHRRTDGALGIIAASESSYSFVNDTYTWGMWDAMWPDFDPGYGDEPAETDWIRPAFANVSGKYYLEASNWPFNPNNKPHTYHLFHHHGDAYITVYSEVPQALSVTFDAMIPPYQEFINVSANQGALIGISANGEYMASAIATGSTQSITIPNQPPNSQIMVTVTKQNYYRFKGFATVTGEPGNASQPVPANNYSAAKPFTNLHWFKGNGGNPEYYKVFFGSDNPPTNIINGEETTDTLALIDQLELETQYFWRVESYNEYGSAEGDLWDFITTEAPDEYFESGDFSGQNWYFDGDSEWIIDNSETRYGEFSSRSGEINEGQTSSLLVERLALSVFSVPVNFWIKTSTVENENKLIFLIDGEQKGEWSGEMDWTMQEFLVGAGMHTYEWKYVKNAASGSDSDCVWIDWIDFPPETPPLHVDAGEDGSTCDAGAYQLYGTAMNYSTIEWFTSGDGIFDDNTILSPLYTPGENDLDVGSATLTLTGYNENEEQESDEMQLTIVPMPTINTDESATICFDETYSTSTATAKDYETLQWISSGDGTFENDTILETSYIPGPEDITSGEVILTLSAFGYEPCGEVSDDLILIILSAPEQASTPEGPDYVDVFYTPTSEYNTAGATNAVTYVWEISPDEAGVISGDGLTGDVEWNIEYLGEAEINVTGINDCAVGDMSESLVVNVYSTVGMPGYGDKNVLVKITPNPNNGEFKLEIKATQEENVNIRIMDVIGNMIYEKPGIMLNNGFTKKFDLTGLRKGLYVIFIEGKESVTVKKFVIR